MRVIPGRRDGQAQLARRAARPPWPLSSALLAAYTGSAAVTAAVAAAGASRHLTLGLLVYAVAAGAVSLPSHPALTPAIAGIAWLFYDGFLVGRHAVLAWHAAASLGGLAVLLGAAAAGSALGVAARRRREPSPAGAPGPAGEGRIPGGSARRDVAVWWSPARDERRKEVRSA